MKLDEVRWLQTTNEGLILRILVQPRASKTEVTGPHGEPPRLRIRLAAPPVDGEANDELIRFLSKSLRIPKSSITLVRGHQGKQKDVACTGIELAAVLRALLPP